MPPKVKVTKEDIVDAAVEILRKEGEASLNARTIATALGCSTQPVFSNFATMEQLHEAVLAKSYVIYKNYIDREMAKGEYPAYKASGMAYIRFAKEEKELFRLLFMRDRSKEAHNKNATDDPEIEQLLQRNTGLSDDDTKFFHLEMWAYVHGIATMFVTGYLDLDWELVSKILSDAYLGMRKQYEGV